MCPLVDIHTHFNKTTLNREGIAVYSHRVGIGEALPPSPFTAGVHPWDAETVSIYEAMDKLRSLPIAGIGEIGLDFTCEVDRDAQEAVFREQLQLAQDKALPIVLHCVKATNKTLKILKEYVLSGVIFHSFVGNEELADAVFRQGHGISIGPRSLKSTKTLDIISKIPAGMLFIETDDSQEQISDMYGKVAAIRNETVDNLAKHCFHNYSSMFKPKQ